MTNLPMSRQSNLVEQELPKELLIYDLEINKAYCLNETSAIIWNLCDGNNSVTDITRQAGKKLKQPVTDDLVWLALDQFKEDNLLADSKAIKIQFNGLSRREIIRKVGFASLIALPVIKSLVAPTAIMAASSACSGLVNTTPCGIAGICCNSQCCEGAAACTGAGGGCPGL